ncbi:TPA: PTS sugar transporter subunit IIC [Clostridioides difficile]|uniref:PTS mannose/fructose/sorbose/N-acetylgalactosamine transporter subunit IIC n=1 Tax=Clostridioides difficile TaxID=1496 RepID=UPI00016C699A|nr:PTS sugar transporter subunit IIC [Clostridioides difficile]AXU85433.1 PTS system transporter subunit IIC [Clostridioides difficile]EGT3641525.1 PTS sugar transporter subunit IIC [Clostridioides difficile]EGT4629682.1 PTS sugar transporter subunit IIC [Clostridioides difficile]EGT5040194.1 PTS sugar transporter subunit IIC [Clostridioides difficile]EGT5060165.1 PTS sugar transporter subunit IIC [Clostridioides difficile]
MHISLIQAVLIAIFYYLSWSPWLTYVGFFTWNRPLLAGFVTGIILGDPVQGAIIGAGINMIYLGFISAGGAQMGDPAFAGYVGTALAIASKLDVSTAMAIAVPLGTVATVLWIGKMTVNSFFAHWADREVQKGNVDRVAFINIAPPQILLFAMSFIPALLVVYFGPNAIDGMLEVMNDNVLHVFNVIGAMLPALGIAMNLKLIGNKFTMPFFILGILMAVYFKVDIIVISVIGVILALTITSIKYGKDSATS